MNPLQKTYTMKGSENIKKWVLIDADGKVLGRLATRIATILKGKNKPSYTPHLDMGDNVIIINAEKVKLSGKKALEKFYFHHSKYAGGKKFVEIKKIWEKKPEFIIEHAVKGMLPKNSSRHRLITNLKIYSGADHPHAAQKPEKIEI